MKNIAAVLLLSFLPLAAPAPLAAQQVRSATLTWTDSLNPVAGTQYNVYRASGDCATTTPPLSFSRITPTPLTLRTHVDSGLALGLYCYRVTAVGGGLESPPSPTAGATIPPFAPGGLSISVTVALTFTDPPPVVAVGTPILTPAHSNSVALVRGQDGNFGVKLTVR